MSQFLWGSRLTAQRLAQSRPTWSSLASFITPIEFLVRLPRQGINTISRIQHPLSSAFLSQLQNWIVGYIIATIITNQHGGERKSRAYSSWEAPAHEEPAYRGRFRETRVRTTESQRIWGSLWRSFHTVSEGKSLTTGMFRIRFDSDDGSRCVAWRGWHAGGIHRPFFRRKLRRLFEGAGSYQYRPTRILCWILLVRYEKHL